LFALGEDHFAPGDVVDTKPEFAKDELPPVDFTNELEVPAVEKLEPGFVEVEGEVSPTDTKTHKAEYYQEFKLDEEQDEQDEEESDMVEVEGKLPEDDTEKHEEIFDESETIEDYEGLVEEEGDFAPDDKGDHEFQEPKEKSEPLNLDELSEEIEDEDEDADEDDSNPKKNCAKAGCNMNGPHGQL